MSGAHNKGASAASNKGPEPAKRTIAQISMPDVPYTYEEWLEVIQENFPDLEFASRLCAAVSAQLLINDITNPFGVVLVDVPSAGKTIALNFFDINEDLVYSTDKFTPASFVSNATNVKAESLKNVDLLPRIKDRVFLVRDMATLFSKREEDLNELLGLMTRVFDGEGLKTDTGVHGARHYAGSYNFMFLAASTPPSHRVWKMMSTLGSRLFFFNLHSRDLSNSELVALLEPTSHKEKERICRNATRNLLENLWASNPEGISWPENGVSKEQKIVIAHCARLLARLRGTIVEDRDNELGQVRLFKTANIEKPARLLQNFYNLARGSAVVRGSLQTDSTDLQFVVALALDSAIPSRSQLIQTLIDKEGRLTTSQIEKALHCSKTTARAMMDTFEALGICHQSDDKQGYVGEPEKILILNKEFEWFLGDECRQIRGLPSQLPPQRPKVIDKANLTPYKAEQNG